MVQLYFPVVTQSFVCLHDNTTDHGQIPHTKRQMV